MKKKKFYNKIRISFILILFLGCQNNNSNEVQTNITDVPDKIDFNYHIRPILSDRCYKCHGPDEKVRKANLRLDTEQGVFALLDENQKKYAIAPGEPDKSLILHRISSSDPEYRMPPPESKLFISNKEIEILKRWIEQGAQWKKHWAFIPPKKQELPNVSEKEWPYNGIDYFILNRLEKVKLQPSEEATKEKLIRRLSFDIRGVPPALEEIDAFLEDNSSKAYERLVNNFMSQSSFGERMALEWLDIARYADSHGYQDDLERSMWPWRDWVIDAFNENMPYDQFLTWQLAGDLYPNASYEQKLATGFNRNHKRTQEGGGVDEEYRVEYALDRVNTFSTALLGLTVACAQCHDHKFDPISQKEFYSLYSFFNNVPDEGRVEYGVSVAEPSIPIPDPKVKKYRNRIKSLIISQKKLVDRYEMVEWSKNKGFQSGNSSYKDIVNTPLGLKAYYPLDHVIDNRVHEIVSGEKIGKVINDLVERPGYYSGGLEFNGENYLKLGLIDGLDFQEPFSIGFWLYNINDGARGVVIAPDIDKKNINPGFQLSISGIKQLTFVMTNEKDEKELKIVSNNKLPPDQWSHVVITYDGKIKADGIKIYIDGSVADTDKINDDLDNFRITQSSVLIGTSRKRTNGLMRARLDEITFFNRKLDGQDVQDLYSYNPLNELYQKGNDLTKLESTRLFYHDLHHKDSFYQSLTERLSEYKIRQERLENVGLKPTMVMAEMDTTRRTYVLERGQYNAPTDEVYPGTPKSILSFPEEYEKNRMGLSKWLFNKKNPLTARVTVNRYWQMIFGKGLVSTPEDFGSQGNLPSHPKLLDWLALEFVSSNWNIKELIKTMVMSSTYRQTVKSNPKLVEIDPENLFLSRGPQNRLQAEFIRDYALNISGLLNEEIGGPSVKPYQPKGLWLEMATGNQPLKKYIQEHDKDLYRKSMYTFWKRSVPPPSMITFDASTREQCTVRRQSTSSPMQALTLLNDPQFVEASRLIAQRILSEGGTNAKERIVFAFRLATSRIPENKEINLLINLLDEQENIFAENPDKAESLLGIGEYPIDSNFNLNELASYTVIASTILNLTESTRKG